jgi:hypothetical protein
VQFLRDFWKTLPRYGTRRRTGYCKKEPKTGKMHGENHDFGPFLWVFGLKSRRGIADAMSACMTSATKTATAEVTVGFPNVFAMIAAKARAAFEALVPLGYQDETGFHTGIKPRDSEAAAEIADW